MDRYDDTEKSNEPKPSRIDKNQELYTDVYLNNVYVDVNDLKDFVSEETNQEEKKVIKEVEPNDYNYEEKNYDIVSIINEKINNSDESKAKQKLEEKTENEIKALIENINEKAISEKLKENSDDLMAELLPDNENTEVIPSLEEPILDTGIYQDIVKDNKEEISQDFVDIELDDKDLEKDIEKDDSFLDEKKSNKYIVPIIILIIIILVGVLFIVLKYTEVL